MSRLQVTGVVKRYGQTEVLRGVDLDMSEGSIVALLGASGSGKTTLLRLIAGFAEPDEGMIAIGHEVVAAPGSYVPTERRRIGYVPQEGALFPHMNVAQNICFGLRGGVRRNRARLDEALRITGLSGLETRYPHQLSGGQQQRTALARALAPRPGLVLLDEPFNALDLDLRRAMAADVAAALRAVNATAILVTHDPFEAFASADFIAAMTSGTIAQFATPGDLYRTPISPSVARLSGPTVFLDADIAGASAQTPLGRVAVTFGDAPVAGRASVMLRPEQIEIAASGVAGAVRRILFHGDHYLATVQVGDRSLPVRLSADAHPEIGSSVNVVLRGAGVAFAAGAG
jgi:iron(III) transport system ATP-binding protein